MQPQTMNAPTIAQKIQSCIHCIVVFSGRLTPLRAIIGHSAYQVLRNSPGNFAILTAIRRASSRVSSLAAALGGTQLSPEYNSAAHAVVIRWGRQMSNIRDHNQDQHAERRHRE